MFAEIYNSTISELEKDLIQVYLKHGYGDIPLYRFSALGISKDEDACLPLAEYAAKVGIHCEHAPKQVELVEG